MKAPLAIVLEFFDRWGPDKAAMLQSMRDYLIPDVIWENVGLSRTENVDDAIAFIEAMPFQFEYMSVDMVRAAVDGDVVLTERVDHLHAADGSIVASFRVMGTFELKDGKIAEWRDYGDPSAVAQFSGSNG